MNKSQIRSQIDTTPGLRSTKKPESNANKMVNEESLNVKKLNMEIINLKYENQQLYNKLQKVYRVDDRNNDFMEPKNIPNSAEVNLNYNTKVNYVTSLQGQLQTCNEIIEQKNLSKVQESLNQLNAEHSSLKNQYDELRVKYGNLKQKYCDVVKNKKLSDCIVGISFEMRKLLSVYDKIGQIDKDRFKAIDFARFDSYVKGNDLDNPQKQLAFSKIDRFNVQNYFNLEDEGELDFLKLKNEGVKEGPKSTNVEVVNKAIPVVEKQYDIKQLIREKPSGRPQETSFDKGKADTTLKLKNAPELPKSQKQTEKEESVASETDKFDLLSKPEKSKQKGDNTNTKNVFSMKSNLSYEQNGASNDFNRENQTNKGSVQNNQPFSLKQTLTREQPARVDSLVKEKSNLANENEVLKKEKSNLANENEELKKQNDELKDKLQGMAEKVQSLTPTVAELKKANDEKAELKWILEQNSKNESDLNSKLTQKEKELAEEKQKVEKLNRKIDELGTESKLMLSLTGKNNETLQLFEKLKDEKNGLLNQIDNLTKELEATKENLNTEKENLNAEKEKLNVEKENLKAEKENGNRLLNKVDGLEEELITLKQAALNASQGSSDNLEELTSQLEQQKQQTILLQAKLEKKEEEMGQQIAKLNADKNSLNDKIEAMTEDIAKLNLKSQEDNQQKMILNAALANKDESIRELENQLQENQNMMNEMINKQQRPSRLEETRNNLSMLMTDKYQDKINDIVNKKNEELTNLKEEFENKSKKDKSDIMELKEQLLQMAEKTQEALKRATEAEVKNEYMNQEKTILEAKIKVYSDKYEKYVNDQKINMSRILTSQLNASVANSQLSIKPVNNRDNLTDQELKLRKSEFQRLQDQIGALMNLQSINSELLFQKTENENKIMELESENRTMEKKVDKLEEELRKHQMEAKVKQNEISLLEDRMDLSNKHGVSAVAKELNEQNEKLKTDLKMLEMKIENYSAMNDQNELTQQKLLNEIDLINEQLMAEMDEKQKIQNEVFALNTKLLEIERAKRQLEDENKTLTAKVEIINNQKQNLVEAEVQLKTNKHELEKSKLTVDLSLKDEQLNQLMNEISNLYKELDKLQTMMVSKKEKVRTQVKDSLKKVDKDVFELAEEVMALKEVIRVKEEENRSLGIVIDTQQNQVDKLESEKEATNKTNKQLKEHIKDLETDVARLSRFQRAFESMEESTNGTRELYLEIDDLKQKIKDLERVIMKQDIEMNGVKGELSQKIVDLELTNEENAKNKQLVDDLNRSLRDHEQMMAKLNQIETERDQLKSANESLESNNKALQNQLGDIVDKIPQAEIAINAERLKIQVLEQEISKKDKQLTENDNKIATLENRNEISRKQYEDLLAQKLNQITILESKVVNLKKISGVEGGVEKMLEEKDLQIFEIIKISNQRKNEIDKLKANSQKLQGDIETLKMQLEKTESTAAMKLNTQKELDELSRKSLADFRKKYKISEDIENTPIELIGIYRFLEEANTRIELLSNFSENQKKFNELKVKIAFLEKEVDDHMRTINKQKDLIESNQYVMGVVERKYNTLEIMHKETTDKFEEKKIEAINYSNQVKLEMKANKEKDQEIQILKDQISDLNRVIKAKEKAYKNFQAQEEKKETNTTSSLDQIKILTERNDKLMEQIKMMEHDINRMKEFEYNNEIEYMKRQDNLIQQIEEQKKTIDELIKHINELNEKVDKKKAKANKIKTKKEKMEAEFETTKEELELINKKYDALKRVSKFEVEKLPELDELVQLKMENEKIKAELEALKPYNLERAKLIDEENEKLKQRIKYLSESDRKGLAKMLDEHEKLKKDLLNLNQTSTSNEKDLRSEIDRLKGQIASLDEVHQLELEGKMNELNEQIQEKDKLREQLKNTENDYFELNEKCQNLITERDTVKQEFEDYKQIQLNREAGIEEPVTYELQEDHEELERQQNRDLILNDDIMKKYDQAQPEAFPTINRVMEDHVSNMKKDMINDMISRYLSTPTQEEQPTQMYQAEPERPKPVIEEPEVTENLKEKEIGMSQVNEQPNQNPTIETSTPKPQEFKTEARAIESHIAKIQNDYLYEIINDIDEGQEEEEAQSRKKTSVRNLGEFLSGNNLFDDNVEKSRSAMINDLLEEEETPAKSQPKIVASQAKDVPLANQESPAKSKIKPRSNLFGNPEDFEPKKESEFKTEKKEADLYGNALRDQLINQMSMFKSGPKSDQLVTSMIEPNPQPVTASKINSTTSQLPKSPTASMVKSKPKVGSVKDTPLEGSMFKKGKPVEADVTLAPEKSLQFSKKKIPETETANINADLLMSNVKKPTPEEYIEEEGMSNMLMGGSMDKIMEDQK